MTLAATGYNQADWRAGARRKRFCKECGTRVSRSAKRCGYCGRRMLGPARLVAVAFTAAALLLFLGRLLALV